MRDRQEPGRGIRPEDRGSATVSHEPLGDHRQGDQPEVAGGREDQPFGQADRRETRAEGGEGRISEDEPPEEPEEPQMVEEGHLHQQVRHARLPPRRRAVLAQGLRDRGLAASQPVLVELELEERREVAGRPLIKGRDIERRAAALFAALTFAPFRTNTSTAFSWPRKAAACRAVPPSRPTAFTSAPRPMSSSMASARPVTAAHSNGVPPRSGSTASTADPARQVPLDGAEVTRSRGRPDVRRLAGRRRAAGLAGRRTTSRGWRSRS